MKREFKTVCSFGDSVMKGIVVDAENSSDNGVKYKISDKSFAARCRRNLGIEVDNFARFGGLVTHGMKFVNRYEDRIKRADYVLFEYGGNDCDYNWSQISNAPDKEHLPNTPLPTFVEKYAELIDAVRRIGARPVLLSLPVLEPDRFFSHVSKGLNSDNILRWLHGTVLTIDRWHERYNMEVFRLSAQKQVPIIDITSVFLERKDYGEYLCTDGIHPNEAGHALIESAIVDFMQRNGVSVKTNLCCN